MHKQLIAVLLAAVGMGAATVHGAYVIEVDTDGLDDGNITYSPDFAFGGDTTGAFQSGASGAIGLSGGDSIYGGNGVAFLDTYIYTYAPDSKTDNLFLSAGTPLGDGNIATGATGGVPGTYAVYATWPLTNNVGGGLTNYLIVTDIDSTMSSINQNGPLPPPDVFGNVWVKIGEVDYTAGNITVTQTPTMDSFVSMRAAGLLFELQADVPPPVYDGPPGPVFFGDGTNQFFGLAFERNITAAQSFHHAVVRSTDLGSWATTDLKLYSIIEIDPDNDLVTFRSMTPLVGQDREFLAVHAIPKMPVVAPYIAMTFDDGPHPTRTPALLDILKARNIRATFYVTGINATWHPHIIRRMINEGHEVANHSFNHPNLTTLTEPEIIAQVQDCHDAIVAAATVPPVTMRPPYGASSPEIKDLMQTLFGYPTVCWDVDPRDWDMSVPDQQVINTILNNASHEDIILAHDIHQRTIDLMPIILDELLTSDNANDPAFSFVTVSELLQLGVTPPSCIGE